MVECTSRKFLAYTAASSRIDTPKEDRQMRQSMIIGAICIGIQVLIYGAMAVKALH